MKSGWTSWIRTAAAGLALAAGVWAQGAGAAETTAGVTDVTAKQRYPWNGLVDITCKVKGTEGETNELKFALSAVMPDSGVVRHVRHFWVVENGTNTTNHVVRANGDYRLLWDAAADLGPVRFTNMVVRVGFDAHNGVQLWEGGPLWAETNIGAEEPWEYGLYFWWGDTVGYKRENNVWVASDGSAQNFSFDSGNTPTYNKSVSTLQSEGWVVSQDGTYVLAPEHDAAQVQWGGGWRMPTEQELQDLCNKCDWTWTATNGVNGYVVRGRGGYADNSIFLPAAGYGLGTSLYLAGSYGYVWSCVPYSRSNGAGYLSFDSGNHGMDYYISRYYGFSVRPVRGFAD